MTDIDLDQLAEELSEIGIDRHHLLERLERDVTRRLERSIRRGHTRAREEELASAAS